MRLSPHLVVGTLNQVKDHYSVAFIDRDLWESATSNPSLKIADEVAESWFARSTRLYKRHSIGFAGASGDRDLARAPSSQFHRGDVESWKGMGNERVRTE